MKEKFKLIRVFLAVPIILCLICSVIFLVYTYLDGQWRFSYHAKIENFSVCNADQSVSEKNFIEIKPQALKANQVYVCGTFETSVPTSLTLLLYKNLDEKPVYVYDKVFRDVKQGDFSFEVLLPEEDITGTYRVDVQFMRSVIATTEFTITTR